MKLTKQERALYSRLGKRGGKARAKSLSPERRTIIARVAALARWAKHAKSAA